MSKHDSKPKHDLAEQYRKAAEHYVKAAQCLRQAAENFEKGNLERAAYQAYLARGHERSAEKHATEAVRSLTEQAEKVSPKALPQSAGSAGEA